VKATLLSLCFHKLTHRQATKVSLLRLVNQHTSAALANLCTAFGTNAATRCNNRDTTFCRLRPPRN